MGITGDLFCTDCSAPRAAADGACTACGSTAITRKLTVTDTLRIAVHDYVGLRVGPKEKSGERRRWKRERSERPALWHGDPSRPVVELQDVDRPGNRKVHEVRDEQTGEILHRTDEPLDQATGRGSAKPGRS